MTQLTEADLCMNCQGLRKSSWTGYSPTLRWNTAKGMVIGALKAVRATDTAPCTVASPQLATCEALACKLLRASCKTSGAYICPIGMVKYPTTPTGKELF